MWKVGEHVAIMMVSSRRTQRMLNAQARKHLLALVRRRIRPGSGSDREFLRSRTMKLQARGVQDLADIARMLGAADEAALQQVRTVIMIYMPDALKDVESMIMLGRLEYE